MDGQVAECVDDGLQLDPGIASELSWIGKPRVPQYPKRASQIQPFLTG
jgi:hypothetical protein